MKRILFAIALIVLLASCSFEPPMADSYIEIVNGTRLQMEWRSRKASDPGFGAYNMAPETNKIDILTEKDTDYILDLIFTTPTGKTTFPILMNISTTSRKTRIMFFMRGRSIEYKMVRED